MAGTRRRPRGAGRRASPGRGAERRGGAGAAEPALAAWSAAELPYEAARTRFELAGRWRRDAARRRRRPARRALAGFEELGGDADADRVAALLRSLGVTGRRGAKRVGTLTRREQEVLRLLGAGLSNPEIAERLHVSRKTASHHVSSILAKLSCATGPRRPPSRAGAYGTAALGDGSRHGAVARCSPTSSGPHDRRMTHHRPRRRQRPSRQGPPMPASPDPPRADVDPPTSPETFQIPLEAAEVYEAAVRPGVLRPVGAGAVRGGRRRAGPARARRRLRDRHRGPHRGRPGRPRRHAWSALDLNEAMLTVARRVRPGRRWRQGDAGALPFAGRARSTSSCARWR